MKRMRIMGLALIAVFATTAIAAASASATPQGEFGRCVAKAGGKYANSGCTLEKAGAEKFEWLPGVVKNKFKSKLKEGVPTLETVGKTKITCKTEESPGEFNTNKSVAGVVAKFTECETSGLPCKSTGAAEGEIVTSALEGKVGVEKITIVEGKEVPSKNKLALELHAPTGQKVASFICAGLPVEVIGSLLHPILGGKMLLSAAEKFVAKAGEQKPDKFAGGTVDEHTLESNTNGGPFEEAGQTITALATYEEKVEANPIKG
jgi:hypothetical protein